MINLSVITSIISKVTVDVSKVPQGTADSSTVESILQFVFIAAGSISVIMIAIGGFKYVTSLGEGQAVAKAKDTILYAVIGLAVSMLAFAIVNFVVGRI
jgi:hypothetical protein